MKTLLIASLATATLAAPALAQEGPMGPGMMFELLDADKDGSVTQAEIDAAKAARFTKADTNADGKLDQAEMIAQAEAMQAEHMATMIERMKTETPKRIAHMMIELDANSDGFITADEMKDDRMGKMFDRLDANSDGSISAEEAEAMRSHMRGQRGEGQRGDHDGKGHHGWFGNWSGGRN